MDDIGFSSLPTIISAFWCIVDKNVIGFQGLETCDAVVIFILKSNKVDPASFVLFGKKSIGTHPLFLRKVHTNVKLLDNKLSVNSILVK